MKVPFFLPQLGNAERQAVLEVMESGWITTGARCRSFEESFARAVEAPHALAVNSCTAALHLALEAVGVRQGDRVLVPSLTFAASAEVVRYLDAIPVFVDSDLSDCNMSIPHAEEICADLERKGTPAKAIIPVHYGGKMVDMVRVARLAERHGLRIVEDAAHAFPSWISSEGRRIHPGTLSDAACFSFYANKTITTGEGGMAVSRDERLIRRMRVMSLHGIDRDAYNRYAAQSSWYYEIIAPGYKYNMSDLAAAIGVEQLKKAHAMRDARAEVADAYRKRLEGRPEYAILRQDEDFHNAWHLFVVMLRPEHSCRTRNEIIEYLKEREITTSVHWTALHQMPYYKGLGEPPYKLPNAESLSGRVISLPIYPGMRDEQVEYVCNMLVEAARDPGSNDPDRHHV